MTIERRKVGSPRVVPWTGKLGSFVNDFTASCDEHFEIHAGESLHKARQNLRIDPSTHAQASARTQRLTLDKQWDGGPCRSPPSSSTPEPRPRTNMRSCDTKIMVPSKSFRASTSISLVARSR